MSQRDDVGEPMEFPELGFYTLPGHTRTPRDMFKELRDAEALGIGSAWISERFDVKELGALAGAASAVTEKIFIGAGATNLPTRHPVVTAGMASTLHRLSQGRFALGLARGIGIRFELWGIPKTTNAQMRDFVGIMRKLWKGESVVGYDGPLGKFPYLHLNDWLEEEIPLLFFGWGPKSLEFAGSVFDGVVLHTFLSDEAVARAVVLVRRGAEKAGRDPDSVRVWSLLATACDVSQEQYLKLMIARMATYMQAPGHGELLVAAHDWDPGVLEAFRRHPVVRSIPGAIDGNATIDQLYEIQKLIPEEWLPAAVGNAEQCASRFVDQFKAGADGIVIHASTPEEFKPVLDAYSGVRPNDRFVGRTNRPG